MRRMTPKQVRVRRVELELTVDELAFALGIDAKELQKIESGESNVTKPFEDAFDRFEECVFGTFAGA